MNVAKVEKRSWWPAWLCNRWGVVMALAGLYVLVGIAWRQLTLDTLDPETGGILQKALFLVDPDVHERVFYTLFPLLALFAAILSWRVTLNRSLDWPLRRAALFFGLALLMMALGDVASLVVNVYYKIDPGVAYPSDAFYPAFFPLVVAGLLSLPGAPLSREARLKFALDLFLVVVVAWMVIWPLMVMPLQAMNPQGFMTQFLVTIYPLGDLAVLAGVLWMLFRRVTLVVRSALLIYLIGLLLYVGVDLLGLYNNFAPVSVGGNWSGILWLCSYWFYALAAVRLAYPGPAVLPEAHWSDRWVNLITRALPFLSILLGYGVVIGFFVTNHLPMSDPQVIWVLVGAALLTFLVVGRQMVELVENVRLNARLRAFSTELEERVIQRTRELEQTQEALLASQKLAIVGTLAAEVVHEVGNPLNSIITASESLEAELAESVVTPETLKFYLPIITRAAWHASRIMEALRSYSRGSAPELVPQSVADVVRDALLLIGPQLKRWGGVKLVTEVAPNLPLVICDRNQMAQLLINLLRNAHDAMPAGGTITLRARGTPSEVTLEVADEGVGIPPETLNRIFDPFYTTKAIGKGTGLGLSIVGRIVKMHNGTIRASSEGIGRGAVFTVSLPAAPVRL